MTDPVYRIITTPKKYINDSIYQMREEIDGITYLCPLYSTWAGLKDRTNKKVEGYEDCSICEDWRRYSNFRAWMVEQDWEDQEIDKDILIPGNRHYSPDTCAFVSRRMNNLFKTVHGSTSDLPMGVHYDNEPRRRNKPYGVRLVRFNERIRLGRYATVEEAYSVYLNAKADYIYDVAVLERDTRILPAIVARLPNIRNGTDPCYTYRTVGRN